MQVAGFFILQGAYGNAASCSSQSKAGCVKLVHRSCRDEGGRIRGSSLGFGGGEWLTQQAIVVILCSGTLAGTYGYAPMSQVYSEQTRVFDLIIDFYTRVNLEFLNIKMFACIVTVLYSP
jgi:hypothetical protein